MIIYINKNTGATIDDNKMRAVQIITGVPAVVRGLRPDLLHLLLPRALAARKQNSIHLPGMRVGPRPNENPIL